MQQEIWKEVSGFNSRYKVSNKGRVYSEFSKRELTQYDRGNGYLTVMLRCEGKCINRTVHSLVAETFLGKPKSGLEIDHIDGDKTNNNVLNLRYLTHFENMRNPVSLIKRYNSIRAKQGIPVIAYKNGIKVGEYICLMDAARDLNVECTCISMILRGKLKTTRGYTFKKRT